VTRTTLVEVVLADAKYFAAAENVVVVHGVFGDNDSGLRTTKLCRGYNMHPAMARRSIRK